MEKILVLFSVPIFLILLLLISWSVLAHYSGDEPSTKTAPAEVKAQDPPESSEGSDSLAT